MSDKYYLIDSNTLTTIANELREKLEVSDTFKPSEFVKKIQEILDAPGDTNIDDVIYRLGEPNSVYLKNNNFTGFNIPSTGLVKFNGTDFEPYGEKDMFYMSYANRGYSRMSSAPFPDVTNTLIKLPGDDDYDPDTERTYRTIMQCDSPGICLPDFTTSGTTFIRMSDLSDMDVGAEQEFTGTQFSITVYREE